MDEELVESLALELTAFIIQYFWQIIQDLDGEDPTPPPPPSTLSEAAPPALQPERSDTPEIDTAQDGDDDSIYSQLRKHAKAEGNAMAKCFLESRIAFIEDRRAQAKELSNQGKRHKQRMEELHEEAAKWIFQENNKSRVGTNEVDLHGLFVKEAKVYGGRALWERWQRGDESIHFIVGRGMHARDGATRLKPAIEELVAEYGLVARSHPRNVGVLIVELGAPS